MTTLKDGFLRPNTSTSFLPHTEVFWCPEESKFYSHCLDLLVLNNCLSSDRVVEFGTGDGSPIINSLIRTPFEGVIHGYELNTSAYHVANSRIQACQLSHKYVIHNQSFFDSAKPQADYLIANPPYLPAPDPDILMPLLHGGSDGATVTKQLLSLGYNNIFLMISSYSNPVETIQHANAQGYWVSEFMILPMKFGCYSSEPKVKNTIIELRKCNKAFYSSNLYLLAGVLFKEQQDCTADLSTELLQVMTAL
ncbi:MAG: SAM-dependent methyltransferase [Leptolyngbyaceae bacterium]|nr:SAM-dependent methyltransferase [Leptolyngbyaceae bacterium]